ncbi:MAG: GNAT family protein [Pseudomonadota bacterium]
MTRTYGFPVPNWTPPPTPTGETLQGRYARLEKLDGAAQAGDLFRSNAVTDEIWDYLPYGPFAAIEDYRAWLDTMSDSADPFFYAIKNLETGAFEGIASYLRIDPNGGAIEVGHINFSKPLQRTRAATETMFLMMKWAFDAGYRRYEWKCDALNRGSRAAAQRLGLSYEGIFRQATVYKDRNRDTAWFAAIDKEWPALENAFQSWLAPSNFDDSGRQLQSLSSLTALVRVASDPQLES